MPLNEIHAWLLLGVFFTIACRLSYVKFIRREQRYIATWKDRQHYEKNRVDLIIALKACKTHDEMERYYPQIAMLQNVFKDTINNRQLSKDIDHIRSLYIRFHFALTKAELKEKYQLQLN